MPPEINFAIKKTRESTSKVRTGCSTCKARRVKCDEAKPICRGCAIGGRKCEYKIARAAYTSRNAITIYLPPMQTQQAVFVKNRGLDFFQQKLAAKLDGPFESGFWSQIVLQLSHSEPSIRHAVSAISVIYQDVESSLRHPAGYVNANPEAQEEWNTAVRSLSARIKAHPNSSLIPLICCLLFTCIEFLRGNTEASMLHVQSGISILAALRRNSGAATDLGPTLSPGDLKAIEDHVVPMFLPLNVLCSLAGSVAPPIYAPSAERESYQEDLMDSRRQLWLISDICLRFIRATSLKAAMFQINVTDLIQQIELQARLNAWRQQLDELLERLQTSGKPAKQLAINLLLLHYKVIHIWMRVCTTAGEMATDSYHADFEELVYYAEQITKLDEGMATPQPLSFDIEILAPLYYTALKCRHPAIRRRALELLRFAPRREAVWNAHYAYLTAKRVVELEERNLNGQDLPNETSRLHGLPLPDDKSRIYNLGETPFDFRKLNHSIVPSPACPGTLEAVFQTKPWGLLGEWQIVTEYIKL